MLPLNWRCTVIDIRNGVIICKYNALKLALLNARADSQLAQIRKGSMVEFDAQIDRGSCKENLFLQISSPCGASSFPTMFSVQAIRLASQQPSAKETKSDVALPKDTLGAEKGLCPIQDYIVPSGVAPCVKILYRQTGVINVQKIQINRRETEACSLDVDKELKLGDEYIWYDLFGACGDPVFVTVETDKGSVTFTW